MHEGGHILYYIPYILVKERIDYKILNLIYRCQNDLAPIYLKDLIKPYCPARRLWSENKSLMQMPSTLHPKKYHQRSFSWAGPNMWNKLPLLVRQSTTHSSFKSALKKYLFTKSFCITTQWTLVKRFWALYNGKSAILSDCILLLLLLSQL